jgi:hypothetical protein
MEPVDEHSAAVRVSPINAKSEMFDWAMLDYGSGPLNTMAATIPNAM